jgi:hypothetical protein
MKYYKFNYAVDTEETGHVFMQIKDESSALNRERLNSVFLLESDKFPAFVPNLNYYELETAAKLTDLLSGGIPPGANGGLVDGFIINKKLRNIFQQHITCKCQYYPTCIKVKNNFYDDYFFMHVVSDLPDYIDYEKTPFFIKEYGDDLGSVKVNSKTEYESFNKQLEGMKFLSSNKPNLKKEIIGQYDLFVETHFKYSFYISEKLKNTLLEAKITGISFEDAKDIEIV